MNERMMKRKMNSGAMRFCAALMILLTVSLSLGAQTEIKYIRKGNSRYSDGKYPDAEIMYRKAIDKNRQSTDAQFNLADALYRQNKFDEAGREFTEIAGSTPDGKKKADSYYNLGNSLFKNNKLAESIEAYKNSLKIDPGNAKAKYNLAVAQDMLRQNQEKNKNQNNQEPSDFAKRLKARADQLNAQGMFGEAYSLMQDGLKKDPTVGCYRDFIDKTGKVAQIDIQVKQK